ncbi:MAG: ComEC/Rec2 family competence protein, partial [Lachnospiraceae bacterium]|nr:ComEC/Rec2 family competence protein [Lachnospiraceae bacterium]
APVFAQVSVSIAVIVGYGIMIDAGTSTLRAILMFSVYLSAKLFGRTYDMATALTIAACVLVTDNPAVLEYAGFVFSFGAILAICLFYPAMKELMGQREISARSKIGGKIYDAFLLSFSVSLFLLPVQLYFYYELQTYAVLVNLAALPVFSVLLYLAFAGGIAAMLSLRVGGVLLLPCRWLFCFYQRLLTLARKLPHGRYLCGRPQKWQIILFYLVVLGVIVWSRTSFGHLRRSRNAQARGHRIAGRLIPVLLLQTAVCLLCVHIRWHTEITFLDVGQGDCCVIEQKSGSTFLIDAGSSDDTRCAERRLLPFLKANGICEVDYAFLSHPDEDHMNALIACMETAGESGVRIKNLVLSAYAGQDVKYEKIIAAAMAADCQVVSFVPGDELRIEDVAEPFCIRCLFPYGTERFADMNDQSLLLKVEVGEFRLLFTGDMAEAEERALLGAARESPVLWEDIQKVDVLKVAHHGSRYSTCAELLDVIAPQAAVISSGQSSRYGHPHAETLQRLEEAKSRLFLTKEMGAVTVTLYESRKSGMRAEIAGFLYRE